MKKEYKRKNFYVEKWRAKRSIMIESFYKQIVITKIWEKFLELMIFIMMM